MSPSIYTEEEVAEQVVDIVQSADVPLTGDCIDFILAIRHERLVNEAMEEAILRGHIRATRQKDCGDVLKTKDFMLEAIKPEARKN